MHNLTPSLVITFPPQVSGPCHNFPLIHISFICMRSKYLCSALLFYLSTFSCRKSLAADLPIRSVANILMSSLSRMCQPVYICRTIRTSIRSEQTVNKINPTYVFMCTKTASFKYGEWQTIRATNVDSCVAVGLSPTSRDSTSSIHSFTRSTE